MKVDVRNVSWHVTSMGVISVSVRANGHVLEIHVIFG